MNNLKHQLYGSGEQDLAIMDLGDNTTRLAAEYQQLVGEANQQGANIEQLASLIAAEAVSDQQRAADLVALGQGANDWIRHLGERVVQSTAMMLSAIEVLRRTKAQRDENLRTLIAIKDGTPEVDERARQILDELAQGFESGFFESLPFTMGEALGFDYWQMQPLIEVLFFPDMDDEMTAEEHGYSVDALRLFRKRIRKAIHLLNNPADDKQLNAAKMGAEV